MRNRILLYLAAVLALAGCAGSEVGQAPANTAPGGAGPLAVPVQVPNQFCAPVTASDIRTEMTALFSQAGMDELNDALRGFGTVGSALERGDVTAAQAATKALVGLIQHEFDELSPSRQVQYQAAFDALVSHLWCFVGISGQVFDLNPGDPVKTFEVPAVGGVQFPANVVPVGTLVSITDLTNGGVCPVITTLDCFPGFLSISTYPPVTLTQPATIVLCPPSTAPTGLVVAHQDDNLGFEILNPVPVPAALQNTCANTAQQPTGPAAFFAGLLRDATNALLPRKLEAAPMMFGVGGIGGTTIRFSPFAAVNPTINAVGGLGGRVTSFAPKSGVSANAAPSKTPGKNAAPGAAPPNNPSLPQDYFQGGVGSQTTTGLPSVTITTPGGDPNGSNPVPGVTVRFTTAASQAYDLDSDAKVCDAQGAIPASGWIDVVTDANGVAALPCLAFGNKAGFANLSATFDPTTLNFPNVSLVTVVAQDGTSSSSSLNWLVKTNAGVPTKLAFVQTPSTTAGAGVALGQQPSLQLLDALDNEVYTGGINIQVAVTSGGGTATYTPVATDANGLATFSDLAVGGKVAGIPQTLSFSFTGISQALTSNLALSAGVPSQIEITTAPSATALAGVAFGTQPAATIEDQYGNVVNSSAAVVASLASGAATLAGTTSVNAVGGVATFGDLRIDGATGPRTIKFTSAGSITSPASGTIDVSAGPASQLVITRQPSGSAPAGSPIPVQPIVALLDQFNNPVTTPSSVTALLGSGPPALAGTTTIPTVNGVATFTDLRFDGVTGNRTLQFTSGNLTSPPTTTPTSVTPGIVASIKTYMGGVAAQSFDYGSGFAVSSTMSPAPQVIVTDNFGNPVPGQAVYWTATTANGGAIAPSSGSTPTNAAGLAQASSWQVGFGANNAVASLYASGVVPTIPGYQDAVFSATAVNTGSLFACSAPPSGSAPNSKADIGVMSVPAPAGAFKKVTLRMSLKNTLPWWSVSLGTLEARLNGPTGRLLGVAIGGVLLPGNGNQVPATFRFLAPVPQQASSAKIAFVLKVFTPHNRQVQVWYTNTPVTSTDPCYNALLFAPGSTTVFNRGLSIDLIK